MSWGYYPRKETQGEKKNKAKKQIEKLRKKGKNIAPIEIEGRTIATSWWGKAWNQNLEAYSDFANRLERGRSYVRSDCVLDLQISEANIDALVLGSGSSIYTCNIKIDPLSEKKWDALKQQVGNKISSLHQLLSGQFPKELAEVFSSKQNGLFPKPSEINFRCSCPDFAYLCKHLAAVIYGVGNRLDSKPELLFILRGIQSEELISGVIEDHKNNLIQKAMHVKSNRIMKNKDTSLSKLFDIDFAMPKTK